MSAYATRTRSATPISGRLSQLTPAVADHDISNHMGRMNMTSAPKAYYNNASDRLYTRYSPGDWETANSAKYSMSDRERTFSENLRTEAMTAIKEADNKTRSRQQVNTKRLNDRVEIISIWRDNLTIEVRSMDLEISRLKEHCRVLEKAYYDTKYPLQIAEECLMQREKRCGVDIVHDNVEKSLTKEVDVIKKCQDKVKKFLEKAAVQQKMNRAALHACEKDARDKHHAQHLDDRMTSLCNHSSQIGLYPGIENVDNSKSIPVSWQKFTEDNIKRCNGEREISEKLRSQIDALIRQCANDMWGQYNAVNNAFQQRIQETNDAKNKLQNHLQRIVGEQRDLDRSIALLKKAIVDKELPLKVAMTRLDERTRRMNVEICHDPAMKGLQDEVHEIRETVRDLREKLRQAETAQVRLLNTKATIEADIQTKENSLSVDSKACMGLRKNMPMDPKVAPIFNTPQY